MAVLRAIGDGAYDIAYSLLNSEDHGLPHHLPRVYIVGRLRSRCVGDFAFPLPLPPVSLEPFLDPKKLASGGGAGSRKLAPMATENLKTMLDKIRSSGHKPGDENFVLDIDASPAFASYMLYMLDRCPCLLKSRPRGYFVTSLEAD